MRACRALLVFMANSLVLGVPEGAGFVSRQGTTKMASAVSVRHHSSEPEWDERWQSEQSEQSGPNGPAISKGSLDEIAHAYAVEADTVVRRTIRELETRHGPRAHAKMGESATIVADAIRTAEVEMDSPAPTVPVSDTPTDGGTVHAAMTAPTTSPTVGMQTEAKPGQREFGVCRRSEAYPSAGGPDCAAACGPHERSFSYVFDLGPSPLVETLHWAQQELSGWSQITPSKPHVSFLYLCCQSSRTAVQKAMKAAHDKGLLAPHSISFDRVVCRLDKPLPHASIILLADKQSNQRLLAYAAAVEDELMRQGIKLSSRRADSEPFHVTIGAMAGVAAREYPYENALAHLGTAMRTQNRTWASYTLGLPFPQ